MRFPLTCVGRESGAIEGFATSRSWRQGHRLRDRHRAIEQARRFMAIAGDGE